MSYGMKIFNWVEDAEDLIKECIVFKNLLLSVELVYLKKILKEGSMNKEVNWGKVGALGNIGLIILNIINLTINIMR